MNPSEDAQVVCNKCGVWDDVSNMKADGHGLFLCIEDAYAQLEARIEQWEQEAKDNTVMRDVGGRPMTEMENWWMNEKKRCLQLEEENEALRRGIAEVRSGEDTINFPELLTKLYALLATEEQADG